MKSIRVTHFGGPEVLELLDVPDPRAGAGQVVVRVCAAGVNPVEAYIRAGLYGKREFPFTPGQDAGGVVEAVGDGVKRVKAGDRVYTARTVSGAYAELALCDAAYVHPLPPEMSFAQGAAVGTPYGTAYRALFIRAVARPGETVLVHGASGGVGTAAVQMARAGGLVVFGTAGTDAGRRMVGEEGAHYVLDHHDPDYMQKIMRLTEDRGVDIVLEMMANVNLGKDLTILAKKGRVVVIGSRGPVEIDPRNTMGRDADIRGMSVNNADEQEFASIHAALGAGLANGTLRPVIGKEFPLADAGNAHEAIMGGGALGKIVLVP